MSNILNRSITIAAGASQSDAFDTEGTILAGIVMPSAWTAADLTLLASTHQSGTFVPVFDDEGIEVQLTVAASRAIGVSCAAMKLAPFRYMRVRSGTSATPVTQAAERVLQLIFKG